MAGKQQDSGQGAETEMIDSAQDKTTIDITEIDLQA